MSRFQGFSKTSSSLSKIMNQETRDLNVDHDRSLLHSPFKSITLSNSEVTEVANNVQYLNGNRTPPNQLVSGNQNLNPLECKTESQLFNLRRPDESTERTETEVTTLLRFEYLSSVNGVCILTSAFLNLE